MLIALTGGTGFLGTHCVRTLVAAGHRARILVRPRTDRSQFEGLPVEWVEGDLDGALPRSFPGAADLLVHLAAAYSELPSDRDLLLRVNRDGTRRVLDAARGAGVPRVVHVSTMGTCAPAPHGRPATEEDHVREGSSLSAYAASKLAGEKLALSFAGVEVVVVNPAGPVGAWDRRPTVTGERIRDVVQGRFPRLLEGPVNYVPAAGCAAGILLAAERGRPRERYLLGGENLGPQIFLERVAAAAGRPAPRRTLVDRLRGRRRPRPGQLAIDDSKARRLLGYAPGDLDQAFREAVAWFQGRSRP